MDVNQLLHNHQLAKLNAQASRSDADKETYLDLVDIYARRIAAWRQSKGLDEKGWPGTDSIMHLAISS